MRIIFYMSALFIVYFKASSLQCSDQFFVWAGISIQASKSIIYFLPFVYNYTHKVLYEYSRNWILSIFVQRFLEFTQIHWMKLKDLHYSLFFAVWNTIQTLSHHKWVHHHNRHSTMGIQSKYSHQICYFFNSKQHQATNTKDTVIVHIDQLRAATKRQQQRYHSCRSQATSTKHCIPTILNKSKTT